MSLFLGKNIKNQKMLYAITCVLRNGMIGFFAKNLNKFFVIFNEEEM